MKTTGTAGLHKALIEGDGHVGLGRAGEAGPAALGVGVQGELAHHQQAAAHGGQIQVHLAVLVLKNPQAAHLVGHLLGLGHGVLGGHPQQHQEALANLSVYSSLNFHRGVFYSGNDCAHAVKILSLSEISGTPAQSHGRTWGQCQSEPGRRRSTSCRSRPAGSPWPRCGR